MTENMTNAAQPRENSTTPRSLMSVYFSELVNTRAYSADGSVLGKLVDLLAAGDERAQIMAAIVKTKSGKLVTLDWKDFVVEQTNSGYRVVNTTFRETTVPDDVFHLNKHILDKQIVDIEDKKLVRVNDIRLAFITSGVFLVAVDVGWSGLLRRLGAYEIANNVFHAVGQQLPAKLILWTQIGMLPRDSRNIRLSVTRSKLNLLKPSDLSDIIEDLDAKTRAVVFQSLDHEKAPDDLEEMEDETKISLVEEMPVEKAADVLEKMPTDEVADLLDDVHKDKAEQLLQEMDKDTAAEVRELMEYPENTAGSLMSTDFLHFVPTATVSDVLSELRRQKPEADVIHSIYVTDQAQRLVGAIPIRDVVVSELDTPLSKIMDKSPPSIQDNDKLGELLNLISKYNLLSVPVVSSESALLGVILINDVVYRMIRHRGARL